MSFLESLEAEAGYTRTLNGAKTLKTTRNACLDLFAVGGGMRYRKKQDQIMLFESAYVENPELAMKLLFYIRDIRGGMGERQMFRNIIRYLAFKWPESMSKNIHLIPEYGRWDDLFELLDTPVEQVVAKVVKEQLDKDAEALKRRQNGDIQAPISLLAKWMPSDNTSSKVTRKKAVMLCRLLNMSKSGYRKLVVELRRNICLPENYLTHDNMDKINYEAVPGKAMLKYRKAFMRKDNEVFEGYLDEVMQGEKTIHCDTLFPYEILEPYFDNRWWVWNGKDASLDKALEALWAHQSATVANKNAISVVDTSGSMYSSFGNGPIPAVIAQALGIYHAERCEGIFHNKIITFTSSPSLVTLKGDTLHEKMVNLAHAPWGTSTNLMAVFELILAAAVDSNATAEEMPSVLYIISDMEFDSALRDADKTVFENAKELFEAYGYQLPVVVFHNVNSWKMQTPVGAHTKGTAMVSGAGASEMKHEVNAETTPLEYMLSILGSKRYEAVHA